MEYINKVTGASLVTEAPFSGANWEPVKKPVKVEINPPEEPKTEKRKRTKK